MKKILKIFENKEKRVENLVFLLVILVITLIIINTILKGEETKENNGLVSFETESISKVNSYENVSKSNELEEKLEIILSKIKGVSNANVLITYSETEEIVPIYNLNNSKSKTEEGEKVTEEETISKDIILDTSSNALVQKIISPKIEGAIIIADGADNLEVKANIISAVEVVTGLASHKIQVFEKGED